MQLERIEKTMKNVKRFELWCECCGEKTHRWDIDMVQPDPVIFDLNNILIALKDEPVLHNFACPACVTEHSLTPLQTEAAKEFRARNEELREIIAPVPIN